MGLDESEQLYGLKIAQMADRKTGVVYPILSRLEQLGWVKSDWEREERGERGPRRRFYCLSSNGVGATRDLLMERRGAVRQHAGQPGGSRRRLPITVIPARHVST